MPKLESVILGTAQWGLNYGISNQKGKTQTPEIKAIIKLANANGCHTFDTSSAYGSSETIIGELTTDASEVITKLSTMKDRITAEITPLKTELLASLVRLKRSHVSGLLLHDASDLLSPNAHKVFRQLEQLKELGYASKIGVSVYSFEEARRITRDFPLDIIQIPYNILSSTVENLYILGDLRSCGVEVHARSVFLQGLLLMDPDALPSNLKVFGSYIFKLKKLALEQNVSLAQYLMQFPLDDNKVDKVVLGVANINQLAEQVQEYPPIDYSVLEKLNFKNYTLLDPRNW